MTTASTLARNPDGIRVQGALRNDDAGAEMRGRAAGTAAVQLSECVPDGLTA